MDAASGQNAAEIDARHGRLPGAALDADLHWKMERWQNFPLQRRGMRRVHRFLWPMTQPAIVGHSPARACRACPLPLAGVAQVPVKLAGLTSWASFVNTRP